MRIEKIRLESHQVKRWHGLTNARNVTLLLL